MDGGGWRVEFVSCLESVSDNFDTGYVFHLVSSMLGFPAARLHGRSWRPSYRIDFRSVSHASLQTCFAAGIVVICAIRCCMHPLRKKSLPTTVSQETARQHFATSRASALREFGHILSMLKTKSGRIRFTYLVRRRRSTLKSHTNWSE